MAAVTLPILGCHCQVIQLATVQAGQFTAGCGAVAHGHMTIRPRSLHHIGGHTICFFPQHKAGVIRAHHLCCHLLWYTWHWRKTSRITVGYSGSIEKENKLIAKC